MSKQKRVFNSILNYDYTQFPGTKFSKPSLTIPDHSLTIPEMIKRFTSGRPVNVKVYDDYGGDDESLTGIDLRSLDISEIHEMMENSRANLMKLKLESDARRKEQQDKEQEERIIAKYEARRQLEEQAKLENDRPRFIQPEIFSSKKQQ